MVLRTFSKLAGMAGLRVGNGVFPHPIIKHLGKVKQPYTPNVAGSVMAIAAMQDKAWLDRSVQLLTAERQRMMQEVPKADVVVVNPTHYAVALRYDDQRMRAPIVVAKGVDLVAARIDGML